MEELDILLESMQDKLENTYVPNTPYSLMNYLHGRCHIFAQVLHEEFGYKMEYLWDNDFWFEDDDFPSTVLVHAYCVIDESKKIYVDARGFVSKELIEYEFECNAHFYKECSYEELKNLYKNNLLEKATVNELCSIREYIRSNISEYK